MSEIDFDRAYVLLTVVEKALGHPKLKPIVDAASAELEAMIVQPEEAIEEESADE